MNVRELRDALAELPDDLRVVVRGYEGGVNDAGGLRQYEVALNVNDAWYYGAHEPVISEYDRREYAETALTPVVELVGSE